MTQLRERAARNVDLSVAKNFGGERYQAWLRGEFLNSFNYAQYNLSALQYLPAMCDMRWVWRSWTLQRTARGISSSVLS